MSAIPRDTREYTTPAILDQPLRLSWVNLEVAAFILLMAGVVYSRVSRGMADMLRSFRTEG